MYVDFRQMNNNSEFCNSNIVSCSMPIGYFKGSVRRRDQSLVVRLVPSLVRSWNLLDLPLSHQDLLTRITSHNQCKIEESKAASLLRRTCDYCN